MNTIEKNSFLAIILSTLSMTKFFKCECDFRLTLNTIRQEYLYEIFKLQSLRLFSVFFKIIIIVFHF